MAFLQRSFNCQLLNIAVRSLKSGRASGARGMCTTKESELDQPVKFSSSKASTWKAQYSRQGGKEEDSFWFEPYVVLGSTAAFLIYFCVLREENDIDEALSIPIYDRIEGLEELQLRRALEYNLSHGLPTTKIVERLSVVEKQKAGNI